MAGPGEAIPEHVSQLLHCSRHCGLGQKTPSKPSGLLLQDCLIALPDPLTDPLPDPPLIWENQRQVSCVQIKLEVPWIKRLAGMSIPGTMILLGKKGEQACGLWGNGLSSLPPVSTLSGSQH